MANLLPSNEEIIERLRNSNKILDQALERFNKREITAKELDEIGKRIGKETRELNRKLKEAKKALKTNAKK